VATPKPRPRRTQQERSAATKGKLIEAALQLLRESGFGVLTVTNVAQRAGLTSGAVQHHFPSSRDLLRGLVEAVYPMLQVSIDHAAIDALPLELRVERIIDAYWTTYQHPDYFVIWELSFGTRSKPELHDFLHSLQTQIGAGIEKDLVQAFKDIGMQRRGARKLWMFIGSQLRGLTLHAMFPVNEVTVADLQLLKKAVLHLLLTNEISSA